MNKKEYIEKINSSDLNQISKNLLLKQVENFYELENNYKHQKHKYKVGGEVKLKKGTLLHGTYKNFEGLEQIAKDGLVTGQFSTGRSGKYLYTVGVWNLKKSYKLKDYINLYSFGCLRGRIWQTKNKKGKNIQKIIPYNEKDNLLKVINKLGINYWELEQTKESRFMPSLSQDCVQIGIIFNGNCGNLIDFDILNPKMNLQDVKDFVHPDIWENFFVKERDNKDIFFTDRESAILFGIPSVCIQGILVGRKYENNQKILVKIKKLLPNAYICNLDGNVIVE